MRDGATNAKAAGTFAPLLVLVGICLVSGVLLGLVHAQTAPIAQANADQRARQTYAALMPEASAFEDLLEAGSAPAVSEDVTALLAATDAQGELVGYVVVAQARGYGGPVPVAVAFDVDGTVRALAMMDNEETPGLGTKAADDAYLHQYVGLAPAPVSDADVDLISGATISSRAVLTAFNQAVAAYEEVS